MHATTVGLADLALLAEEEHDEPLAGQEHSLTIQNLHYPLYAHLRGPACFVASELRVYRDPHNLNDWREPDVLVALGVPDRVRPGYALWLEGKAPDLVLEVLSPDSVRNRDLTAKRDWYGREGVREYVVVDPAGAFAPEPRLQAWRLGDLAAPESGGSEYVLADEDGILRSRVAPVGWVARGEWVRVVDLATGDLLPTLWELEPRLREEIAARQEAQERAGRAEARVRELEAELEQLRRQHEGHE